MEEMTLGKAFYYRQVSFLEANNVEGLIASQYAVDAELVGFGLHVKGRDALIKHFTGYLANLGGIKLVTTDKYMETENAIMFEASIRVSTGLARVYDAFVLKNGKATQHFTGLLGFTPNS